MKKLMLAVGLVMLGSRVFAFELISGEKVSKTSFTLSADLNVQISSVQSVVWGVLPKSTGTGTLFIYDTKTFNSAVTTKTAVDCVSNTDSFRPIKVSSGLMYAVQGNCGWTILWDWITHPKNPNGDYITTPHERN